VSSGVIILYTSLFLWGDPEFLPGGDSFGVAPLHYFFLLFFFQFPTDSWSTVPQPENSEGHSSNNGNNEKLPLYSRHIIPRLVALSERENKRKVFAAAAAKSHHSNGNTSVCDGTAERNLMLALLVNDRTNPEAVANTKTSDLAMAKVIKLLLITILVCVG